MVEHSELSVMAKNCRASEGKG